jgi:glucose/arabinose dehydrogenase
MDMEFAPDGRLFVAEQAGRVRIAKPDGTLTTFLNISTNVDASGDHGLQALTFDPGFSTNRYVYLQYTKKTTPAHNRIVRVTASGDKVVAGSEKLIFRLNNQAQAHTYTHHMGGAIDFGKDGKLYIATGDNETPTNSQQLTNLFGKLLRINKDGTIPTDNPFYKRTKGQNRAIWARGLRNPFKMAVKPGKGTIFINDVGGSGSQAYEEINRGAKGANYGFPVVEGPAKNPKFTKPIYSYRHKTTTQCCVITGGAFYDPRTERFPKQYVGDYFFTDNSGEWIRVRDSATGKVTTFATGIPAGIGTGSRDLEVSKNGSLYQLGNGYLAKISYTG